ncbi:MAG TPA: transglycosylase SLT domain-containing protein [Ktedonobacteraceae bacterium]|jgi:soluble lytic murein transglycosylase-like protein|nr:transglycosylase SLT domain-containing protein [Ktedonobacteraceae bacterium]
MKEGGTFFVIAIFFLALFYGYIESQGGFAVQASHQTANAQSVACNPCNYHQMARQDAIDNHIDPDLFERQIAAESAFNPNAQSVMGARGIAQIMPATAAGWHVNAWDPVASLSAAAKAMAWYQGHYGSFEKALACYNAGASSLDTAMARYGADWRVGLPGETQRYIRAIVGY